MSICKVNMKSIPLEKDLDWWWYRAKDNLLRHILSKENRDRYKNILEIGPGYGNNLKLLSSYGDVDILETDNSFIKYLQMNLSGEYIKSYQKLPQILNKYDLIIMLDVLEHIDKSKEFMITVNHLLKKDGLLIIGVPAYKSLWSEHDVNLKHYRRYSWKTLREDCSSFRIKNRYGFNYLTLPLRFLQIKLNPKASTTKTHGDFVNFILYKISEIEKYFRIIGINPKFGISIYASFVKK